MVRHATRKGVAAMTTGVLWGLSFSGCVSGDIPARPMVGPDPGSADAGAGLTQLASAPGCGSINLVVVNGAVYWTEKARGTIKSVPTAGGSTTVIATAQSSPGPIAVDGTSVFWVDGGHKTIMKKVLKGGAATVFVAATTMTESLGGENDINALLVDKGTLFFGRYTDALKVPTGGGTPKVIGRSPETDVGKPAAFAIDATHLYQTEIAHLAVSREALDGTQNGFLEGQMIRQPLAPDRIEVSVCGLLLDAIAVVNGNVVWADNTFKQIETKPVDAGENVPYASATSAGLNPITGFVVSGNTIYLGESLDNNVEKMPLPTSADADAGAPGATVIATNQMSPSQFAADDTNIYWRTADCKIMKLAK
jgi:hypothetical protein